jgi:ribosomal protein L30/L7E
VCVQSNPFETHNYKMDLENCEKSGKISVTDTKKTTILQSERKVSDVIVVVRIRAMYFACHKTRSIIKKLGLSQIYSAVIILDSRLSRKLLQIIDPFVTYGKPTSKIFRELIYKRGRFNFNGTTFYFLCLLDYNLL